MWIAPPERVYNYRMLDTENKIHPDVQVFSVDDFSMIKERYGLEHIQPYENLVLIKNPYERDKYCKLSDSLEKKFYETKLHYIELVCKNIGAKSFKCECKTTEEIRRKRNPKAVATIKYTKISIGGSSQKEGRIKDELKISSIWNPEPNYERAKAIAEEHNLMDDPTVLAFLSDITNHMSYNKSVVLTQEVNHIFDIAFTLSGLEFFKFFDSEYRNIVEYSKEISVDINVEF
ncbi:MAG: hypothetical protein IKS00_03725 [Bacteroidales bacterium]|nr:hypothetical protein [Bacteroidales bacterium]